MGVVLLSAVLLPACGGEAALDDELARSSSGDESRSETDGEVSANEDASSDALPTELAETLEREALAPGYREQAYPGAPYGFVDGSVIPNFDFLGWSQPTASDFDIDELETLSMADFYDPDGDKGIELLMINAVAVWCGVCQAEYVELREQDVYGELKGRGLEMLGVLFEDADALPARYSDLVNWSRAFNVQFPFVLDPGFKMGAFFDRSATPMNMVVDARTMQVLISITGYNPEIFGFIDRELTARGR